MPSLDFPSNPLDGDLYSGYIYNATKGVWDKVSISGLEISSLSDVSVVSPGASQTLVYNTTTQFWENRKLATQDLSNVSSTAPTDGQLLIYSTTTQSWTPGLLTSIDGGTP